MTNDTEQTISSAEQHDWWEARREGAIVSNLPTGHDDKNSIQVYGGHLVCESCSPKLLEQITALPDLLRLVGFVVRPYMTDSTMIEGPVKDLRDKYLAIIGKPLPRSLGNVDDVTSFVASMANTIVDAHTTSEGEGVSDDE